MDKHKDWIQFFLRLAIASSYLKLGLDRLGAWGPPGRAGVSWGNWQQFMEYARQVMSFLPKPLVLPAAIVATVAEISIGISLLLGFRTRIAAIGSGLLALLFAIAMSISFGIHDPLGYSVFTVSAGSLLLATVPYYRWSLDAWTKSLQAIGRKQ